MCPVSVNFLCLPSSVYKKFVAFGGISKRLLIKCKRQSSEVYVKNGLILMMKSGCGLFGCLDWYLIILNVIIEQGLLWIQTRVLNKCEGVKRLTVSRQFKLQIRNVYRPLMQWLFHLTSSFDRSSFMVIWKGSIQNHRNKCPTQLDNLVIYLDYNNQSAGHFYWAERYLNRIIV